MSCRIPRVRTVLSLIALVILAPAVGVILRQTDEASQEVTREYQRDLANTADVLLVENRQIANAFDHMTDSVRQLIQRNQLLLHSMVDAVFGVGLDWRRRSSISRPSGCWTGAVKS